MNGRLLGSGRRVIGFEGSYGTGGFSGTTGAKHCNSEN